jgi:thiol-disulfide isomerase/thioredoxin
MKLKIIIPLIVMIITFLSVGYDVLLKPEIMAEKSQKEFIIQDAVDFNFKTIDGKEASLFELENKTIFLNFWASWCGICKVEFPELLELTKREQGNIAFIAVSIDDKQDEMMKFLNKMKKEYPDEMANKNLYLVWDEDKDISLNKYNVIRTPETFFINQEHKIFNKIIGETKWLKLDGF